MMFRCYGDNRDEGTLRNYGDCSVYEEWHNFQNFAEWCQTQKGMNFLDSQLDKDIKLKGNRTYSPDNCCFVPGHINSAITGFKHLNSSGSAGVWKFKDSYIAEVTTFSTKQHLGTFDNLDDAEYVYKRVKSTYISALADVYKDRLAEDVYLKLKGWQCD
jgi:hypothetical protein